MRRFGGLSLALFLWTAAFGQNLSFGSREARSEPEWMTTLTIYEIWLNAFSKEGTLHGAIPGLKHVSELGASVVYLGPIAKRSPSPHASPYNIADYSAIDSQYGNDQDLRDFVSAAHTLGLKVMLDIVYYHTAPDGVMMKNPNWLVHTQDGKIARGFWPQPLPDYNNPQVRRYLIEGLLHWVRDFKVDGFRCDVGAGVPVSFWEEARKSLDQVNRDVILLSESDRPDDQLQAFDINYNFQGYLTLRSVIRDGQPAIKIREEWEQNMKTFPHGARLLRFSDNHDWRRAVVQFGDEGALAASILNFTLDGIPFLYNGQEIADCTPTHWLTNAPIQWPERSDRNDSQVGKETLAKYKRLFAIRNKYAALTSGELLWINNSEPDSVLSFLRRKGEEEILVILNVSNRNAHVTIDLPVMDYSSVENLLTESKMYFQLYSGRVSADLSAYQAIVGKRIPL
ncbi:MAG: alpha-amylase family glycosyl hydrolase, partial [Acidobacteriota bacterium]|nr:alpha-amylase family glycosyl hydrolase [Acidobacteriota bacterium]